ncbi:MAG TPA: hypothetical protein VF549_12280 [Solirubrobacteraceae bacterium]|jgi:hypothetical protein
MPEYTPLVASPSTRPAKSGATGRLTTPLILAVTVIFIAAVGWSTQKHESKSQAQIAGPTKALAAAIQAADPSAAPEGAEGYVKGVREQFGRVRVARFLDAYTARNGAGRTATTDTLSEILVRARRGAGVLELSFDGATINGVRELEPGEAHTDLSAADEAAVARGFARRGGRPANITVLDGTFTRAEIG